jgi:hypothetical protein
MSQHLIALHEIESERIALIEQYTQRLEEVIERVISARVAEAVANARAQNGALHRANGHAAAVGRTDTPGGTEVARRPGNHSPGRRAVAILPPMPSREPTVIPAHVQITRLPPGPRPDERRRAGPPMDCRLPGCLIRSRGPRYEYFCEEHYRLLNADERRHYAAMWRAARAAQRA